MEALADLFKTIINLLVLGCVVAGAWLLLWAVGGVFVGIGIRAAQWVLSL